MQRDETQRTSFQTALSDLKSSQKSRRGVSLYSRFVNRPVGRILAAACYTLRMTPNQVTAASAVVTALGLALLVIAPPTPPQAIGVALLLMLGFALDSADGQVARLTGRGSPAGEWLDHVVDAGKHVAVHAAVLAAVYLHVDADAAWYLIPLGYQLVAIVTFVGGILAELLKRAGPANATTTPRSPSVIWAIALLPADYGILALTFVLFGWPHVFLIVYAVLFAANFVLMLALLVKWFGELRD